MGKLTKILLGAASVVAIATAAHSADAVVPVEPASAFNWSGFYIGMGGGVGANVHELSSPLALPGVSLDGIGGEGLFGELTVGYDYMVSPRFLVGAFVDAHYGNIETSLEAAGLDASVSDTYGFDAGVRAGYLFTPTTLGYLLGGYAWQKAELDVDGPGDFDWDRDGYFVGAGVETAISGNWTLKTEYRFSQFGTTNILEDFLPDGVLDTDTSRHTFHVAANYRFGAQNGGGASFEAPAYNWTGFYVGGALGAGAVVHDLGLTIPGGIFGPVPINIGLNGIGGEGVFGEASVGYDHDFGNFVAGVMVDGSYSGITTELDLGTGTANVDADYGFDVLARAGMKVNESTLAYALAGYSWQHFDIDVSGSGSVYDWGASGFSVGGGLETAVNEKLAVNLEYRYSQFEDEDFSSEFGAPAGTLEAEPSFHTVRIGAKYKFN